MEPYAGEYRRHSTSYRGSKSDLRDFVKTSLRPQPESDDARLDRKTRQLFDEWQRIERKSDELRKETNRLRAAKDEAKKIVLQNFPHLFRNSDLHLNNADSSEESSTVSSDSSSLDDDTSQRRRFKNDKVHRRLQLSNELRNVYDMLQRMNENDVSGDGVVTLTPDEMKFNVPATLQTKQFNNVLIQKQDHQQGPLGQLLSQLKVDYGQTLNPQHEVRENLSNGAKIVFPAGLGSSTPYGFIPIPVDYETYNKWMSQHGQQPNPVGLAPPPTSLQPPRPPPRPTACNQIHPGPNADDQHTPAGIVKQPARFLAEVEDGEDTSQDAADLVSSHDEIKMAEPVATTSFAPEQVESSQDVAVGELKVENFEDLEVVESPKPRSRLAIPKSAVDFETETSFSKMRPETTKKEELAVAVASDRTVKPKEEDDNFMIESDNVDENLYSSESETTSSSATSSGPGPAAKNSPHVQQKLKFSSSSSSQDVPLQDQTKPKIQELSKIAPSATRLESQAKPFVNLGSDSDSPPPRTPGPMAGMTFAPQGPVDDVEISGPENELDDDDFWN